MIGGMRILVLEGEPLIAMDLEDLLVARGFKVIGPFSNATDALDSLDRANPQAALLDVYLNGASFDVGRELKRRDIPFAFTTGMTAPDLLPPDLAGSLVIHKVWNVKELLTFLAGKAADGSARE
jgi:DNA-binding response OmpR family regulator